MKKVFLFFVLSLGVAANLQAQDAVVIEPYNLERDRDVVVKILDDNAKYLRYENLGYSAGTTEKYLVSTKYKTDVLLVDGKTVGFINYAAFNISFLTFNLGRAGLIHLMGVDKDQQRNGHGKLLFKHAIEKLKELNTPIIRLCVKSDNAHALALYEKEGFTCVVFAAQRAKFPDLMFSLNVDVPADKLPKGNLMQRYPKTTLGFLAAGVGGYLYLKSR